MSQDTYSIGTDIGGTFTDCTVLSSSGRVTTGKSPSTPPNFSEGFFNAVEDAAAKLDLTLPDLLSRASTLVHATTAATNAMVQRKGARVGLITTRGHGDAILIMRGGGRSKGLDVEVSGDFHDRSPPYPSGSRRTSLRRRPTAATTLPTTLASRRNMEHWRTSLRFCMKRTRVASASFLIWY